MTSASDWPCRPRRVSGGMPRCQRPPSPAVRGASAPPDDDAPEQDWDTGTVVEERPAEPKVKRPPLYKVILLNDDYTRMEFVVHVLMRFFDMDPEKATQVMYTIHTGGSAVVGIYTRDIAETKSEQVNAYAQENEFPLRSTVEMTD